MCAFIYHLAHLSCTIENDHSVTCFWCQTNNFCDMSFYRMISFVQLRVSSLCGNTIEFSKIFSDGTLTKQPKIVIDGFNFPSLLNKDGFSILANGLFGSGSLGVPSTRAHEPIIEFRPTVNVESRKKLKFLIYIKRREGELRQR